MEFKIGDVVMLKSGGPSMTISEIGANDIITCIWFENSELKSAYFKAHVLVHDRNL